MLMFILSNSIGIWILIVLDLCIFQHSEDGSLLYERYPKMVKKVYKPFLTSPSSRNSLLRFQFIMPMHSAQKN